MSPRPALREPTADELQAALDHLHRNGLLDSVPTLLDAMHSPHASRLVRMHARLRARGVLTFEQAPVRRPAVVAPEAPHPASQRRLTDRMVPRGDLFDLKRAASGDRDDD